MMEKTPKMYHERQRKQLCALHVINNLLQDKAFTQGDLDGICTSLTPQSFFNPHRSVLGLGNYDVNVVTAALQSKGLSVLWFDKRKDVENIDFSQVKGIILNIPAGFLSLPIDLNFKHWFVIREVNGTYYNLDSKLSQPESLGTCQHVIDYLSEKILHKKTQMLVVVSPDVEESGMWYLNSTIQHATSHTMDAAQTKARNSETTHTGNGDNDAQEVTVNEDKTSLT